MSVTSPPAALAACCQRRAWQAGLPPWYFIEVTDIEHIKKQLTEAIEWIAREVDEAAERRIWTGVQASTVDSVWGPDDDKLFEPTR